MRRRRTPPGPRYTWRCLICDLDGVGLDGWASHYDLTHYELVPTTTGGTP